MRAFFVYVDADGKMPQLQWRRWSCRSHPYFVQYDSHGRPIAVNPYPRQTRVWNYAAAEYVPLAAVPLAVRAGSAKAA